MYENNKFMIIYSNIKASILKSMLTLKLFIICNSLVIHVHVDLLFIISCI